MWPGLGPNCLHYVSVVPALCATCCTPVTGASSFCQPACLPALVHTRARTRAKAKPPLLCINTSSSSSLYIVSRSRLCSLIHRPANVWRPVRERCRCVARTCVCTKERGTEFDRDVPHRNETWETSACARPLSTLVNGESSHQSRPPPVYLVVVLARTRFAT